MTSASPNSKSSARCAAALGIDAVLLTKGCADPLYRRAIRVSMGNVFLIPFTTLPGGAPEEPVRTLQNLREQGFRTVAMALNDESVSLRDPQLKERDRIAVVLGTEGEGLRPATVAACEMTCKIPMAHGVDSLNVAAAAAITFWELGRGAQ